MSKFKKMLSELPAVVMTRDFVLMLSKKALLFLVFAVCASLANAESYLCSGRHWSGDEFRQHLFKRMDDGWLYNGKKSSYETIAENYLHIYLFRPEGVHRLFVISKGSENEQSRFVTPLTLDPFFSLSWITGRMEGGECTVLK